jgi:hypothetical protein
MREQDAGQEYVEERVNDMLEFFETVNAVYEHYERIPTDRLKELFQKGNKLTTILDLVARK